MDAEDLDTRQRLLTDRLVARLGAGWEQVGFTVDAAAATDRPGAPISVSWTDGPTLDQVATLLAPEWTTRPEGEGHAYPVALHRAPSAQASAAAIVALADTGELPAAVAAGRNGFGDVMLRWFSTRTVPAATTSLWPRAELLAGIASTRFGDDVFAWASWLVTDGGHILTHVLPGALDPAAAG